MRRAFLTSLQAALGATAVALVLGSLLSFAVHRFRFFGRETVSFLVILPIALPGIVTGIALNTAFRTIGIDLSLMTIIIGHATFCIVVVYNNVIARLRRNARSTEEASMDLGADTGQTFRHVTLPGIVTALVAGALLAFALSFDEIIVTTFTSGAGHADPADLDLQQLPATGPGAPRERRGGVGPPPVDHPRLPGAADHRQRGRRRRQPLGRDGPAQAHLRPYHFMPAVDPAAAAARTARVVAAATNRSRNLRTGHLHRPSAGVAWRPTPPWSARSETAATSIGCAAYLRLISRPPRPADQWTSCTAKAPRRSPASWSSAR